MCDVANKTDHAISVSINHWGKDGNTDYFTIAPGKTEHWDRSDTRGFVMVVNINQSINPYYVFHSDIIYVNEDSVTTQDGLTLKPISKSR
jgi:hypothetical protein